MYHDKLPSDSTSNSQSDGMCGYVVEEQLMTRLKKVDRTCLRAGLTGRRVGDLGGETRLGRVNSSG